MKLLRHGERGQERPGLVAPDGSWRDLTALAPDFRHEGLSDEALDRLRQLDPQTLPRIGEGVRLGPCVAEVGKFICIGLNYRDHARETNAEIPAEPILFLKASSAIQGPNDEVLIPLGSTKTDWEVELAVVIGRTAKRVAPERALEHVVGYCVTNDLSEREYQLERGGTWDKGKGCDTFGPLGPYLVTRDEVPDPQALHLWLDIDGERKQDSRTSEMIFGVAELISYVSRFMTLHPGDVISTGTPHGVALGQATPPYLRAGQTIRLGIAGLGEQRQQVRNEEV